MKISFVKDIFESNLFISFMGLFISIFLKFLSSNLLFSKTLYILANFSKILLILISLFCTTKINIFNKRRISSFCEFIESNKFCFILFLTNNFFYFSLFIALKTVFN